MLDAVLQVWVLFSHNELAADFQRGTAAVPQLSLMSAFGVYRTRISSTLVLVLAHQILCVCTRAGA